MPDDFIWRMVKCMLYRFCVEKARTATGKWDGKEFDRI